MEQDFGEQNEDNISLFLNEINIKVLKLKTYIFKM